ncbi:MAG: PTS sugar transporter subunit IIA [Candidatus Omnitrophota bacterium]
MLLIAMHNNIRYLYYLSNLAKKEGIRNSRLIEENAIGRRFLGSQANLIFSRSLAVNAYDKAFVALVEGQNRAEKFLDTIEHDDFLDMLNMHDQGFICVLPQGDVMNLESEFPDKKEEVNMKIFDFLKEERVLFNLKAEKKEDAINEMACILKDSPAISDFDLFVKEIFERESLGTTGIGNYVAIPHARTDAVKEFVIAMGRSPGGIEFNSLDDRPAKLIFLIGTPKEKNLNGYLQVLARLTRLLNKESIREELLKAQDAKSMIDVFSKAEK